ncbi:helix-turn-helix transcriptional regulator [Paractinoplanes ferrugineus]|uniref:Transcriptional regulator n=1 Tax=Paractinoplanes ferrugineus TaxID=113564 RepID=A0A919J7R6_9ACTN|nr:helix-turn-helix transcriptional regulator [Actinoplanes ferrugineus]GIE16105.1 transcriptional regulator [Actinoplanes ferrugineus]
MSETTNALGAYLRARRELVTPEQAGIPGVGVRRVPGLRREEVAMLAGISADYYLRLERGRDRNPSVQVLESIARVLQLDDDHMAHLLTLVAAPSRKRRRRARRETPPPGALKLLDSLVQPAFIEDRYFDILASNSLAKALSPRLAVGGNQMRDLFLDPTEQALHPDWQSVTECFVANLRQAVGTDTDDPRFIELTGELTLASPRFRQLWARHEVRGQRGTPLRINHPQVGEMTLNRERLSIGGSETLMLVVYHPDPGSTDADKLALLASAALPSAALPSAALPSAASPSAPSPRAGTPSSASAPGFGSSRAVLPGSGAGPGAEAGPGSSVAG